MTERAPLNSLQSIAPSRSHEVGRGGLQLARVPPSRRACGAIREGTDQSRATLRKVGAGFRPDIPVLVSASEESTCKGRCSGIGPSLTTLSSSPATAASRIASPSRAGRTIPAPGSNQPTWYFTAHAGRLTPLAALDALAAGRPVVVSRVRDTEFLAGVPGVEFVESPDDTEEAVKRFADAVLQIHKLDGAGRAEHYFRSIHEFARAPLLARSNARRLARSARCSWKEGVSDA
jgi:hypothetical protein